MFDSIRKKIAAFIVKRELKSLRQPTVSFKDVFRNAYSFFVLMPDNEIDFHHALEVLKELDKSGKIFTILSRDFRVSLLPPKYHRNSIGFGIEDMTKLNLPKKNLCEKLSLLEFNFVIDLNREENLFCCYAANLVKAGFRIGVMKENADKYYNMQISGPEDNPEMFYKNFLNCLQMF